MKPNEIYTTPDGKKEKVLMFDEDNKMVHVKTEGGSDRWVHEPEYRTWTSNNTAEMPKVYVPDMPSQMTEEQAETVNYNLDTDEIKPEEPVVEEVKKKRTYKKKTE